MNKLIYALLAVAVAGIVVNVFLLKQKTVQAPTATESIEKGKFGPDVVMDAPKENEVASQKEIKEEPILIVANKIENPPLAAVRSNTNADEPVLFLKSIGIELDYYDPATNRAGDFLFTKSKLAFNRLFMPFGFVIPANTSSTGANKTNPQPTFIVPLGTPVRSLVDGIVVNMPTLWSGDVSIHVTANGKIEKWIYETEHVMNPTVRVGDRVTAGQIVGEASNFDKGAPAGFGAVEIGILKGGNPPEHVCPFAYLDPSIKDETMKKITALYKAWEDYVGDTSLYGESEPVPGCATLVPIEN